MNQGLEKRPSGGQLQKLWIVLLLLAVVLAIVFIVLYFRSNSDLKVLEKERAQEKEYFEKEIDSVILAHNNVKKEYKLLADSLLVKDSIIIANAKEIKSLLQTKWEFQKVQKKLNGLREIAQGYLVQIDSLYTVNKTLKEENVEIKAKYQKEKQNAQRLTQEKKELNMMVKKASAFRVYNIEPAAYKENWLNNEKPTDRASRVNRLRICFTVGENELTDVGEKELYFRISGPDGSIITPSKSDSHSFILKGDTLQYTMARTVDYQGDSYLKCVDWIKPQEMSLEGGRYVIEVYSEEAKLSQSYMDLK